MMREIREPHRHYYAGDLNLSAPDGDGIFDLRWDAYEGGSVILRIDFEELERLRDASDSALSELRESHPWLFF